MKIEGPLAVIGFVGMLLLVHHPAAAADAEAGAKIFKTRCGACHTLDKARVGPPLGGVVGRQAGTADYNRYVGLKGAEFTWTPELLYQYLEDPSAFVKAHTDNSRSAMVFKLADEEQRQDVIAYLQTTGEQ